MRHRYKAALQAQAHSQYGQDSADANAEGQADVLMIRGGAEDLTQLKTIDH